MSYGYPYLNPYLNQQPQIYRVIPISNIEEANKMSVDFNGTPTYFHNQATNEIYIKQFDVKTGLSNLQVFSRASSNGKSKNDINPFEESLNTINKKLDTLAEMFNKDEEEIEKPKKK